LKIEVLVIDEVLNLEFLVKKKCFSSFNV